MYRCLHGFAIGSDDICSCGEDKTLASAEAATCYHASVDGIDRHVCVGCRRDGIAINFNGAVALCNVINTVGVGEILLLDIEEPLLSKSVLIDLLATSGHEDGTICRLNTIKCILVHCRRCGILCLYSLQTIAVVEGIVADFSDVIANGYRGQAGAILKNRFANCDDAVRYSQRGQAVAIRESPFVDSGDAVGDGQRSQANATCVSIIS